MKSFYDAININYVYISPTIWNVATFYFNINTDK